MNATTHGHNSGAGADHAVDKRRWRTPPRLIHDLELEGGLFDLDAAASPGAQICPRYIAPPGAAVGDAPEPVGFDCLNLRWRSLVPREGGRIWANFPWGQPLAAVKACAPNCRKRHEHITTGRPAVPGTANYVKKALSEALDPALRIVLLLPTAPDTSWWRMAFWRSAEVRLLPRVRFLHPDTGVPMDAPPGCGVTLFFLAADVRPSVVNLATVRGLRALPMMEVDDE